MCMRMDAQLSRNRRARHADPDLRIGPVNAGEHFHGFSSCCRHKAHRAARHPESLAADHDRINSGIIRNRGTEIRYRAEEMIASRFRRGTRGEFRRDIAAHPARKVSIGALHCFASAGFGFPRARCTRIRRIARKRNQLAAHIAERSRRR